MDEELRAAEAHIRRLEEELLRLKDVKRDLEQLRRQHQLLRRSAEGRLAQLLTAPWRIWSGKRSTAPELSPYERWLAQHRVSAEQIPALQQQLRSFEYQPLISVLMPTFESVPDFLQAAVQSVIGQIYQNWELVIVDDGSKTAELLTLLRKLSRAEPRIRVFLQERHSGISAALNRALGEARGAWIALLDHDDLLEPDALFRMVEELQCDREADLIYSDEDKIVDAHLAAPMLKPDWSPELFLTHDYIAHLVLVRSELAREGFRSEFDGAQDYDLLLRLCEKTAAIRHLPRVLYHWRRTRDSTAHNIRRKPGALEAGRRAIEQHLERRQLEARVTIDWPTHAYRVRYKPREEKISVILFGEGDHSSAALDGSYNKVELLSLDEVAAATGQWLLFLQNGLEPFEPDWLRILAEQLANPQVGAVGPRIIDPDGKIESAGYVLMPDATAQPAFAGYDRTDPGMNRQLQMTRNYSAVSASCLLTRRDLFEKITAGSFTLTEPVCTGVDYCLKLRDAGFRTVVVAHADLRRTEPSARSSVTCGAAARRWPRIFERDPFYNCNLSTQRADFSLPS